MKNTLNVIMVILYAAAIAFIIYDSMQNIKYRKRKYAYVMERIESLDLELFENTEKLREEIQLLKTTKTVRKIKRK
jgi:hypothetical protein